MLTRNFGDYQKVIDIWFVDANQENAIAQYN